MPTAKGKKKSQSLFKPLRHRADGDLEIPTVSKHGVEWLHRLSHRWDVPCWMCSRALARGGDRKGSHGRTVHAYFPIWSAVSEKGVSLLERALKKSDAARARQGRNASSTFLIVDAQSVKNADTGGQKGDNARK